MNAAVITAAAPGRKRIREGIFEDVEPLAEKGHGESGQASKGAHKPGAHRSILGRIPVNEGRLREFQEIKIAKDGRGIILLHNAAAGALWILSLDFPARFRHNRASACWIDAMPAVLHVHN